MMRTFTASMICNSLWLCGAVAADKTEVFKCPTKDGVPSFTDQACADGELITIDELPTAGLSMMVPELPPLPPKPEKIPEPASPIQIVVVQPPPMEYQPWPRYLHYPVSHRSSEHVHPHRPRPSPIDIEPPRPTPAPARPLRTRVEIPEALQPKS